MNCLRRWGALVLVVGLVAAGCSKKDESSTASTAAVTEATDAAPTSDGAVDTAATTPTTDAPKPEFGGSIIVSGESEVANPWTPAAMQCDAYCHQRARTFYEPLTALGTDNEVHGVLADSFTPNTDFTEWTVRVREGITFHDGTPLDADAVIKNLQTTGTSLLISKALNDVAHNPDGSLKIEKTDPMTFVVFTGRNGDPADPMPWPGFARALGSQWGLIASPAWLDGVAAGTAEPSMPIGTGPFMVKSFSPGEKTVVIRNPDYWQQDGDGNQLPYLDSIEFRVFQDPATAGQALRSGDIDMFSTGYSSVIADFRDSDPTEFVMDERTEFVATNYLLIDLDKPGPLQDKRVRCALSKAIDRQELIDLVAGGIGQPANGLFSPGQEGYLEDNGFDTAQDVAGAKALIDEYVAETGQAVSIPYGTTVAAINAQTAELLLGYWKAIGVDITIQQVPQDQYITNALFGVPDFTMYAWSSHAGVTADEQAFWWSSPNAAPDGQLALNFGRIRDEQVDAGLAQARSGATPEERRAGAEAVNRRFAEECYQIPQSWGHVGTIRTPAVRGLGETLLPDGTPGEVFTGFVWPQSLWIDQG
ncbi:MAG: ABC transporter substrate-binding protein [Ilumatobacteraceae bacterium]